jgi:hypothetical protein
MKIRMLKSVPGSVDGTTVRTFAKDEEHDLSATEGSRDLAAVFLREKWAEEARPAKGKAKDAE